MIEMIAGLCIFAGASTLICMLEILDIKEKVNEIHKTVCGDPYEYDDFFDGDTKE